MRKVPQRMDKVFRQWSAFLQMDMVDLLVEAGLRREVLDDKRTIAMPCFTFGIDEGTYFSNAHIYLFVKSMSGMALGEVDFSGIVEVAVDHRSDCVYASFKFTRELLEVLNRIDSTLLERIATTLGSGVEGTRNIELEEVSPWFRVFEWRIPV